VAPETALSYFISPFVKPPLIRRVFTMGAQYAYWSDYATGTKVRMVAKWHVLMPLITMLFGYFPGKKLGWLEDTPKGVVRDWALSRERFEDTWRGRSSVCYPDKHALVQHFAGVTAPILAVSVTDDEFGTVPAVERLLAYFSHIFAGSSGISPTPCLNRVNSGPGTLSKIGTGSSSHSSKRIGDIMSAAESSRRCSELIEDRGRGGFGCCWKLFQPSIRQYVNDWKLFVSAVRKSPALNILSTSISAPA
jgi:hypothetical protein